jgi:hypothetical protein
MNIRIRYFAAAVEAAGCEEEEHSPSLLTRRWDL